MGLIKRAAVAMVSGVCFMAVAASALAGEVGVFAAASLREAINELCDSYGRNRPGVRFLKTFGGSGQLAKQIESGAPADIFLSSNVEWVDYLKARRLLNVPSIGIFAYNTLVFAGTSGKVSSMQDVATLQTIAIGSPRSVPAGEYAAEAMTKAGVMPRLKKKLVMAKDARECLMYVERGEVDGGFVYRTDALRAKNSRILFDVPQNLYTKVTYPMALTLSGAANRDAATFLAYLRSQEARKVLARHGFALR